RRVGGRRVHEARQPDQLEPARPEPELVVAADLVVVAALLAAHAAHAVWQARAAAGAVLDVVEEHLLPRGIEVADRAGRALPCELRAQPRPVDLAGPGVVAHFAHAAVGVVKRGRAAGAAVVGGVVETERVVEAAARTAHRDAAAGPLRIGVVAAHVGTPFPLPAQAFGGGDDIRDLSRQPGDIQAGAVHDLDPDHVVGRHLRELREHVV